LPSNEAWQVSSAQLLSVPTYLDDRCEGSQGSALTYEKGLSEVADGIHAYLQPDGGWGWSNAGLILGNDQSLLVDTLFDLSLTKEMLDSMASLTDARPIETLVNTHANGDHCYGNQLVTGAEVIASEASDAEMAELPPAQLAALLQADLGEPTNSYLAEAFGSFDFNNIEPPRATRTFSQSLSVNLDGRQVDLIEVGPAHTAGDVLVHVPDADTVFTGDILFIEGTPLIWQGPVSNWIAACDRIIEMGCSVIVPGHGPLTDQKGVQAVADYLNHVYSETSARYEAGMDPVDAAHDIKLGGFGSWLDWERLLINVDTIYRELDPSRPQTSVIDLFRQMAVLKSRK